MLTLWFARRAREQIRRINRMMRRLPVSRIHARNSPLASMPIPKSWLPMRKQLRKDRVFAIVMLVSVLLLGVGLLFSQANAESQPVQMYVCVRETS